LLKLFKNDLYNKIKLLFLANLFKQLKETAKGLKNLKGLLMNAPFSCFLCQLHLYYDDGL